MISEPKAKTSTFWRNLGLWLVILIILVLLLTNYASGPRASDEDTMADFVSQLEQENVAAVALEEVSEMLWEYTVTLKEPVDGDAELRFVAPNPDDEVQGLMKDLGVAATYRKNNPFFSMLLIQILPILVVVGILVIALSLLTLVILRVGSPRDR